MNGKTKITLAIALIFMPLVLVFIRSVVIPTFIWPIGFYYEFRYDYSNAKNFLSDAYGLNIYGKDGYVAKLHICYIDQFHKNDVTQINKFPRLHTLRINTREVDDHEIVCSQMKLLNEINCPSLTEMQYDFTGKSYIDCLCVPDSIITLRIRGSRITNEDLMELAKFDQIKEVLLYVIFTRDKENDTAITEEGIKDFNEIRPDVKIWWNKNIKKTREKVDFILPDFEHLLEDE